MIVSTPITPTELAAAAARFIDASRLVDAGLDAETELGEALDQAKQAAPTRPHPQAPDQLPGLALAGPVAAIYDRLRDRLQGRPLT